jgi:hypothetical protein
MHGISQFYDTFFDKSPFKNVEKPTKPVKKAEPKQTTMSESEKKRMHATQSVTDKSIKEQDYPGQHGVIIGEGAPEMSPFKAGGYEGAADVVGAATYIPTADMYTDMFSKIGQAVADIDQTVKKNKNKKDTTDFDKKIKESDKKLADELAKAKKEREELENTEPFWDGTKWTRKPKPGLNTVISTTTKLG